jgi:hypothetical protein
MTIYPTIPAEEDDKDYQEYFHEQVQHNVVDEPSHDNTLMDKVKTTVASIATKENLEFVQQKAGETFETVKTTVQTYATKENFEIVKAKTGETYEAVKSGIARVATTENYEYAKQGAWYAWSSLKGMYSSLTTSNTNQ